MLEISCTFIYQIKEAKKNVSFHSKPSIRRSCLYTEDQEIHNIAYFSANPRTSIWKASANMELPRTSIKIILEKYNWHPFCVHGLQELHPSDFNRRALICNWLLIQQDTDSNFVKKNWSCVLWRDTDNHKMHRAYSKWHCKNCFGDDSIIVSKKYAFSTRLSVCYYFNISRI